MIEGIASSVMGIMKLMSPNEVKRLSDAARSNNVAGVAAVGASTTGATALSNSAVNQHSVDGNTAKLNQEGGEVIELKRKEDLNIVEAIDAEEESENSLAKQRHEEIVEERKVVNGPVSTEPVVDARTKSKSLSLVQEGEGSALDSIGIMSADQVKQQEQDRVKKENQNRPSTSLFLINEREKFRNSKAKIITRNGLKAYAISSKIEITKSSNDDEGEEVSSNSVKGVLLNKRQY